MKQNITNSFEKGLTYDLHPMLTPNSVLTDNINGTYITYNGNEFCLQNDRGNYTDNWKITDGFTPIGIKERNGVLYIVSVNQEGFTEIGSFPSPDYSVEKGKLQKNYKPLHNLKVNGIKSNFNVKGLNYSIEHPVTIEIQNSYDGSVNLILTDGVNKPRIINTGFSVNADNYEIITRNQKISTNEYDSEILDEQISLIRINSKITNIFYNDIIPGGQLMGGNYTFYIKFGDGDYNQTDVVAESGIFSVFKGTNKNPSSISGTLYNERTDKTISLKVSGLNEAYSKIYVYYTREFSDTLGYRMTECKMLKDPIDIKPDANGFQTIFITGYEQTVDTNIEELNVEYHTIDFAKAQTQESDMLFLGNVGQKETYELYKQLKNVAQQITVTLKQHSSIGNVSCDYSAEDACEYYNTENIYKYVGYWPDEYYRFGVVFILKDGSTTPVFNVRGGTCKLNSVATPTTNMTEFGIVKVPNIPVITGTGTHPLYFTFNLTTDLPSDVNGWFIVRQKRIPITICQGLTIGIDELSHLPLIFTGDQYNGKPEVIIESFLKTWARQTDKTPDSMVDPDKALYKEQLTPILSYCDASVRSGTSTMVIVDSSVTSKYYNYAYNLIDLETDTTNFRYADGRDGDTTVEEIQSALNNTCDTLSSQYHQRVTLKIAENDGYSEWSSGNGAGGFYLALIQITGTRDSETDSWKQSNDFILYAYFTKQYPTTIEYPSDWFSGNIEDVESANKTIKDNSIAGKDQLQFNEALKFISENTDNISNYGLLSLDPCVNPTVRSMLDGSVFHLRPEWLVSPSRNKVLKINNQYFSPIGSGGPHCNAVFVPFDTNMKMIGSAAFSNVAGNVFDPKQFKYASEPLFLACSTKMKKRDKTFVWEFELKNRSEYANDGDYKHQHNVNLIRGRFCPYIGVTDTLTRNVIYSVRLNNSNITSATLSRSQDNSPYYTVSNRFSASTTSADVFRGDCYSVTNTIRIVTNFIDQTAPVADTVVNPQTWAKNITASWGDGADPTLGYDKEYGAKWSEVNLTDLNSTTLGYWVTFKCLSSYNTGLRSVDVSHEDETALIGQERSFFPLNGGSLASGNKIEESWLLNDGYSATVGEKRFNLLPDTPYNKSEFTNRIMFSNVNITDAFINGYRTFQGLSYKDYDKQYGPITKLISWQNNLFCVMEHGLGIVGVNEKALMQTTTGDTIHIYGHGVLSDDMQIVSQDYGSKYEQSVVKTPLAIYGIDTNARKIWRFGSKGFETISDMHIESLLNNTMNNDYDIAIGKEDVRTHYNSFKGDIIFTWYNDNKQISICYNERQQLWVTKYDWIPMVSENNNGEFYSLQKKFDEDKVYIWSHEVKKSEPTQWFGEQRPFEFEFVVSEPSGVHKILENLQIISNNVQPEQLMFEIIGDVYQFNKERLLHTSRGDDEFNTRIQSNLLNKDEFNRPKQEDVALSNVEENKDSEKIDLSSNFRNTSKIKKFIGTSWKNRETKTIKAYMNKDITTGQYHIHIPQECRNLETYGRRLGNIHYVDDSWYTNVEPLVYDAHINDPNYNYDGSPVWKSTRIRDKWIKIRVRYTGEDLAIIAAIKSIINI